MTATRTTSFFDTLRSIRWGDVMAILGFLGLLNLLFAHLIWLTERHHNPDFPKSYLRGVGEGLWWAVVTVVTVGYGDRTPKGLLGRAIAIVWMLGSVLLIANITAAITSRLTVERLQSQVSGLSDLPGKRVVTVANTTADQFLSASAIAHGTVEQVEQAYALLEAGEADAVVYDAPILNYYASTRGQGKVRMVGEVFKPEPYGIALQRNSPYRKAINRAILEIFTDGTHRQLTQRWFGTQ
jgi:polar amino acid transport system substrate-binding protein